MRNKLVVVGCGVFVMAMLGAVPVAAQNKFVHTVIYATPQSSDVIPQGVENAGQPLLPEFIKELQTALKDPNVKSNRVQVLPRTLNANTAASLKPGDIIVAVFIDDGKSDPLVAPLPWKGPALTTTVKTDSKDDLKP